MHCKAVLVCSAKDKDTLLFMGRDLELVTLVTEREADISGIVHNLALSGLHTDTDEKA